MDDEVPERAQLGHPAEAEVPQHLGLADRDHAAGAPLEDSAAYELAVEDGRPLPPDEAPFGGLTGTGPQFREPGA